MELTKLMPCRGFCEYSEPVKAFFRSYLSRFHGSYLMKVIRRVICSSSGLYGGKCLECRSENVVSLTPKTATAFFRSSPISLRLL